MYSCTLVVASVWVCEWVGPASLGPQRPVSTCECEYVWEWACAGVCMCRCVRDYVQMWAWHCVFVSVCRCMCGCNKHVHVGVWVCESQAHEREEEGPGPLLDWGLQHCNYPHSKCTNSRKQAFFPSLSLGTGKEAKHEYVRVYVSMCRCEHV